VESAIHYVNVKVGIAEGFSSGNVIKGQRIMGLGDAEVKTVRI
jgi:hypothetical protein